MQEYASEKKKTAITTDISLPFSFPYFKKNWMQFYLEIKNKSE